MPRSAMCEVDLHNTLRAWKETYLEKGPEVFSEDGTAAKYERRIAELER